MIAALTSWIKEIIYIILFASFMEFLLPNGQMRKFIRVIIGLFIMLAILSPIMEIMNKGLHADTVSAWNVINNYSGKTGITAAADNKLTANQDQLTRELYRQQLAKQIRSVVVNLDGVGDAQVVVELDPPDNKSGKGAIQKILITVQQRRFTSITPVTLGKSESPVDGLDDRVKIKVANAVAELYQISPKKIFVQ